MVAHALDAARGRVGHTGARFDAGDCLLSRARQQATRAAKVHHDKNAYRHVNPPKISLGHAMLSSDTQFILPTLYFTQKPVHASVPAAVRLAKRGNTRHAKITCLITNAYWRANPKKISLDHAVLSSDRQFVLPMLPFTQKPAAAEGTLAKSRACAQFSQNSAKRTP